MGGRRDRQTDRSGQTIDCIRLNFFRIRQWQWRKPGAEFGGTEKFSADQDDVFYEKISILAAKISDDFFLVIDQVFRIFTGFQDIYFVKCRIWPFVWPFPHMKAPFFILFILSSTSDNTTSQNIGGTNAWAVPPPQTLGDVPQSPLGFRPWAVVVAIPNDFIFVRMVENLRECQSTYACRRKTFVSILEYSTSIGTLVDIHFTKIHIDLHHSSAIIK